MNSNITTILISVSNVVPTMMIVLRALAGLVGIYFIGNALYQYYSLSNPQSAKSMSYTYQATTMGATIQLIVGSFLISFAQENAIQNIVSSMVGMNDFKMPASMSYISTSDLSLGVIQKSIGTAIENIMILIGSIAIFKGLLLARRISIGLSRESYAHVWTYITTGALCLNIKEFSMLLDNTFGFHFSKFFF